VSQLVLVDSDFARIPKALAEGRRVVNNMTRLGCVFLIKTIYTIFLTVFIMVSFTAFPFAPVQILLYDGFIQGYPTLFLMLEPSNEKVRFRFLPYVMRRAIPYSFYVLLVVVGLMYIPLGLADGQATTIMFLLTGIIGGYALFAICRPMNWYRAFVLATSVGGFFVGAIVASDFLQLTLPSIAGFAILAALALFFLPYNWAAGKIMSKFSGGVEYPTVATATQAE